MFFGTYSHKLDVKGRLMIPAKFRREITGTALYLLRGFEGSVSLFSEDAFQKYMDNLKTLSYNDSEARAYLRVMLSSVVELPIDGVGRLLFPKATLETYKLSEEVVVVGVGDHFEVWDKPVWDAYISEKNANISEIADRLEVKHG
jgi:MraZ protein